MSRYLKLFKLNFRQNMKVFISFNIISVLACLTAFFISRFRIKGAIENSISNSIELAVNINSLLSMFTLFMTVLFILFVLTTMHIRFSDYLGTLYTTMQVPVDRSFHIVSIVLESLIFIAVQYVLFYILLNADYNYLLSSLSKVENAHLYKLYETFKGTGAAFSFGEQIPLWNLTFKNVLFRILICWPAIACYSMLGYMISYKFGVKKIIIAAALFIVFIIFTSSISAISNITDFVMRHLFEVLAMNPSMGSAVNSLVILIGVLVADSYMVKRKLDF